MSERSSSERSAQAHKGEGESGKAGSVAMMFVLGMVFLGLAILVFLFTPGASVMPPILKFGVVGVSALVGLGSIAYGVAVLTGKANPPTRKPLPAYKAKPTEYAEVDPLCRVGGYRTLTLVLSVLGAAIPFALLPLATMPKKEIYLDKKDEHGNLMTLSKSQRRYWFYLCVVSYGLSLWLIYSVIAPMMQD